MQNTTNVALSRMVAQQRAMDVTAGNIANANTPGFRAERLVFSDFLVRNSPRGAIPGDRTITFTQDRASYRDLQPGPLSHTSNPLDLALGADGYFTVETPRGTRLTRAGHFELSPTGGIVDSQGNALLDTGRRPLQVATADTNITVSADGTVSSENGRIGRIAVVRPADPFKIKAEGERLFNAEGTPVAIDKPKVIQGAIENSNIAATLELTRMMRELREFEFTSKLIQAESDIISLRPSTNFRP